MCCFLTLSSIHRPPTAPHKTNFNLGPCEKCLCSKHRHFRFGRGAQSIQLEGFNVQTEAGMARSITQLSLVLLFYTAVSHQVLMEATMNKADVSNLEGNVDCKVIDLLSLLM